ncbi:MAG TPA: biotin/lipoyl-containing protein [Euzebyales bacterium]|nr:biotin/lipoyl-containing protein [Euzebyales bacterium]
MREAVRLPQWGMGMSEGAIIEWLKAPGDSVTEDEPIAVVEAAKIETELEAPYTGTLTEIVVQAGETVDVGTILAWMDI